MAVTSAQSLKARNAGEGLLCFVSGALVVKTAAKTVLTVRALLYNAPTQLLGYLSALYLSSILHRTIPIAFKV
jgi:hypothetical protein